MTRPDPQCGGPVALVVGRIKPGFEPGFCSQDANRTLDVRVDCSFKSRMGVVPCPTPKALRIQRRVDSGRNAVDTAHPVDLDQFALGLVVRQQRCGLFVVGVQAHHEALWVVVRTS